MDRQQSDFAWLCFPFAGAAGIFLGIATQNILYGGALIFALLSITAPLLQFLRRLK